MNVNTPGFVVDKSSAAEQTRAAKRHLWYGTNFKYISEVKSANLSEIVKWGYLLGQFLNWYFEIIYAIRVVVRYSSQIICNEIVDM